MHFLHIIIDIDRLVDIGYLIPLIDPFLID